MFPRKIIKGLLIPSYVGIGVVNAKSDQDQKDECDDTKKLIRPRELPLYVEPPKCVTCSNTIDDEDGFLLTTIRCARQELQSIYQQAKVIQSEVENLADEAHKNTKDVVDYLRQEENLLPRLGAIGLGSFAGYLLACRKGFFKKVLYSVAGATAVTAISYPTMTKEYGEMFLCEFKKGVVIGYHFLNGAPIDYKKLETIHPPCVTKKGGNESGKSDENKTEGERDETLRSVNGNNQDTCRRRRGARSHNSGQPFDAGGTRPRTRRRDKENQKHESPKSGKPCGRRVDDPTTRSIQPDGQPPDKKLPGTIPRGSVDSSTLPGPPSCQGGDTEQRQHTATNNWTQRCDSQDSTNQSEPTSSTNQITPCKSVVKRSSVEVTYPTPPRSEECTVHCPDYSKNNDAPAKVSASVARTHLEARLLRSDGVTLCRCRHEPFR